MEDQIRFWNIQLKIKGVRLFLLRFQGNRALIYVYREKQLASRLNSPEVDVLTPSNFDSSKISAYDAIAFGCPAMGAEVLEEAEFEPMWNECEGSLSGVKIALFGSYGWGDGEWMRTWEESAGNAGAILACDSVMANEEPDDEAKTACRNLGQTLA